MQQSNLPDIATLEDGFDAIERDARALVSGLTERTGGWRAAAGSWSVAECLDHLASANFVYLRDMQPAAERALQQGRTRRGPAQPGLIGRWFVQSLEPPVTPRSRRSAPDSIRPRHAAPLSESLARFLASHREVRAFVRRYNGIDLAGTRFANPFVRGIRFSLATGLHVLAAHERRHLWQAWRVREAADHAVAA